jgi:hypothetical protein
MSRSIAIASSSVLLALAGCSGEIDSGEEISSITEFADATVTSRQIDDGLVVAELHDLEGTLQASLRWELASGAGEVSWADSSAPEPIASDVASTSLPLAVFDELLYTAWTARNDTGPTTLALYSCEQGTSGVGFVNDIPNVCGRHCQNCGYSWGLGGHVYMSGYTFWYCACY